MTRKLTDLPDDIEELKRIIALQNEALTKSNSHIALLEEKVKDLISRLYSRKSEKLSKFEVGQSLLFDEIEAIIALGPELALDSEEVSIPEHKRKKKGRRPIPDDLPRREQLIDIPDEEKICSCGAQKVRIGEETSEKVDYIPAEAFVRRTVRPKYACNKCHGDDDEGPAVSIAPVPPSITGKSILAEGLFGHIIVSKFADALPFYRQEIILRRAGVEISRSTMASLAINVYERLKPLKYLMEELIKEAYLLGIDETTLQVLNEPGRKNTQLSYMWHILAHTRDGPVPYFTYRPTRSAEFLEEMLSGFQGAIVTDGWQSYNRFDTWNGVVHAGCNAHARRKFVEAEKVSPGNTAVAGILKLYKNIYRIEADLRDRECAAGEILQTRREKTKPLMDELRATLVPLSDNVNPQSKLGMAVSYTLKEWPKLVRYLEDPKIPIDNNPVENGIRPFVVGRKNWLFSNTPNGADASAFYYTLIEWTKNLNLDPYLYMSYLFRKAPLAVSTEDWKTLLPSAVSPELLEIE